MINYSVRNAFAAELVLRRSGVTVGIENSTFVGNSVPTPLIRPTTQPVAGVSGRQTILADVFVRLLIVGVRIQVLDLLEVFWLLPPV